jgi:hypothetical protein
MFLKKQSYGERRHESNETLETAHSYFYKGFREVTDILAKQAAKL